MGLAKQPGGWCSTWTTIDFSTSTVENTTVGASIRPAVFCLSFFFGSLEDKDSEERWYWRVVSNMYHDHPICAIVFFSSIYIDKIANLAYLKNSTICGGPAFCLQPPKGGFYYQGERVTRFKSPSRRASNHQLATLQMSKPLTDIRKNLCRPLKILQTEKRNMVSSWIHTLQDSELRFCSQLSSGQLMIGWYWYS